MPEFLMKQAGFAVRVARDPGPNRRLSLAGEPGDGASSLERTGVEFEG
ncbi:MAG: hypothetical protein HQL38_06090 [Alphaproteobacteria bacterium]|nr:hypothetical protein [Alphaproteobacteria bacterium]